MAVQGVAIPPASDPVLDDAGAFTAAYRRFLEGLWRRVGGFSQISIEPTSDTTLTFYYKGSDGVIRSGSVTLS